MATVLTDAKAQTNFGGEGIHRWATQAQRGFIKGRRMLQNILEVETKAMELAASLGDRAALIFLDFGAAFPSLSHEF